MVMAAVKIELNPCLAQGKRKAFSWSRITFLITEVLSNEKYLFIERRGKGGEKKFKRRSNDKN